MHLADFDESGDVGLTNRPTQYFVLSSVLVHGTRGLEPLDGLVKRCARPVRARWGISVRAAIKSTDIRRPPSAAPPVAAGELQSSTVLMESRYGVTRDNL